jgi:mRNA interferase YafQ
MYHILFSHRFKKERKKYAKSGRRSIEAINQAIDDLIVSDTILLPQKYQNHQTRSPFDDCRDMHAEPDTVILYRIEGKTLTFIRVGSHADLFGSKSKT